MCVGIIGGGLAGLLTAIQLKRHGVEVTVFEKKKYPFHRVCGEYISNETVPFLQSLGLYPAQFSPPVITELQLTSVSGEEARMQLDLGGFGISRFVYDEFLVGKARQDGVLVLEETEVDLVNFAGNGFVISANQNVYNFDVVIGAFGKRSKLDVTLKRNFIRQRSPYVGVKYHIKTKHPDHVIALHNFKDGYCGMSNVEGGKTNLCYLTHRNNVRAYKNISDMEQAVLHSNPFLKKIFAEAEFLFSKPEVINEISFATKAPVENHMLMLGDAAGMITPLCGNGMALAIHASKIAAQLVTSFYEGEISRTTLETKYAFIWRQLFARRLWAGRQIQNLFGGVATSNLAVSLARYGGPLAAWLVKQTHGKPF